MKNIGSKFHNKNSLSYGSESGGSSHLVNNILSGLNLRLDDK